MGFFWVTRERIRYWMVMKIICSQLGSQMRICQLLGLLGVAILVGCDEATPPPSPPPASNAQVAAPAQTATSDKASPAATEKPAMPDRDSAIVMEEPKDKDNAELAALAQNTQSQSNVAPPSTPKATVTPNSRKEFWITSNELPRNVWDVMYLGNSKIGSMHTEVLQAEGGDGSQLKLTLESLLRVTRGGQSTTQRIAVTSREKTDGELLELIATIYEGTNKTEVTGVRVTDNLIVQITQPNGQSSRITIPWKREYRGPFALEQELLQQPLTEGETREIPYLCVPLFRLANLVLKGGGKQKVAMLDGSTQELQEVMISIVLDKNPVMETVAWVNEKGESLKSAALGLQVLTYRSTQSAAESVDTAAQADLLKVTSVPLPAGTPNLHLAQSLTYNIRCSKDPLKLFPSRTNQTVRSAVALECDITVYTVTPDSTLPETLQKQEPPTDADLNPSPMIESNDPLILEMAHHVLPEEKDPWKISLALERYVHDKIERKDFSRSFATAAEVAKIPRGDCTEHGVLLAALLRARKIPARIASGLVYVDSAEGPMMGYHMWTEAYVGDRWIPLDAVLGKGGIGPGHIKVMDTSLADQNPYVALLPVLQVLGDLKITSVKAP